MEKLTNEAVASLMDEIKSSGHIHGDGIVRIPADILSIYLGIAYVMGEKTILVKMRDQQQLTIK